VGFLTVTEQLVVGYLQESVHLYQVFKSFGSHISPSSGLTIQSQQYGVGFNSLHPVSLHIKFPHGY
jgi:hypothetical protein